MQPPEDNRSEIEFLSPDPPISGGPVPPYGLAPPAPSLRYPAAYPPPTYPPAGYPAVGQISTPQRPAAPPRRTGMLWAIGGALLLLGCALGSVGGFLLGSLPPRLAGVLPLVATARTATPAVAGLTPASTTPTEAPHTSPGTTTVLALATALTAEGTRVYGPASGRLAQRANNRVAVKSASVTLQDFIVEAEVTNPYDPVGYGWDYGLIFASINGTHQYRLYLTSDADWSLKRVADDGQAGTRTPDAVATAAPVPATAFTAIAGGVVNTMHLQTGETNRLRLLVKGRAGIFLLNDTYVATFTLPADLPRGDIEVGSAFKIANNKPGTFVSYKNFSVWSLDSP